MVKKSFERLHKLKEIYGSSSKVKKHEKKCDFNKLVFNKILYVGRFQLCKTSFTAKSKPEKLTSK